jgi:hypothetical protein
MSISPLQSVYAAQLAANSLVVARRLPQRRPLDVTSRLFLPVGLQELPELLDCSQSPHDRARQLSRISSVAALKTLERGSAFDVRPGLMSQLLSADEKRKLRERHARGRDLSPLDREGMICRYCAMFEALVLDGEPPPIFVVNHSAGINVDFDVESNISEASVNNYQLLLPKRYALKAIDGTHPLRWDRSAPDSFDETAPAKFEGRRPHGSWACASGAKLDPAQTKRWQEAAAATLENAGDERSGGYLYERAVWPWNKRLTTRVENVLKIRSFANIKVDAEEMNLVLAEAADAPADARTAFLRSKRGLSQLPVEDDSCDIADGQARILHYQYSLESCIRSSYGIGWEDYNGLNVDDGKVSNVAVHWSQLQPHHVANLKPQDLEHLYLSLRRTAAASGQGDLASTALDHATNVRSAELDDAGHVACEHVRWIAERLDGLVGPDLWFLDVSASKALRFSFPLNGPIETWSALTWMAPAILFTFLNRAVCQLPYALLKDELSAAAQSKNGSARNANVE